VINRRPLKFLVLLLPKQSIQAIIHSHITRPRSMLLQRKLPTLHLDPRLRSQGNNSSISNSHLNHSINKLLLWPNRIMDIRRCRNSNYQVPKLSNTTLKVSKLNLSTFQFILNLLPMNCRTAIAGQWYLWYLHLEAQRHHTRVRFRLSLKCRASRATMHVLFQIDMRCQMLISILSYS
jgi:hypothetical protein